MIAPEPDRSSAPPPPSPPQPNQAFWDWFGSESGSILVVGHGTRNPSGALQLLDLVGQMQAKVPPAKISGCFLELAEPSIEQAMQRLSEQGIKKTLVVPVLLFTAGHALQDIPEAVAQAGNRFGIEVIGQTSSLGTHPSVMELSQLRYAEVIAFDKGHACPVNACARVQCNTGRCEGQSMKLGRIGLAMVGRGTSDQQAIAHMRQLTELKVAQLSVVRYQTGFFAGGKPNVDGLLEEASQWECESVLVQPHLLFEGELIEQLREKVLQCQQRYPDKQWLIARTLGADPKLADVFLELARQEVEDKDQRPKTKD